jgi:two-component sensor histidine kinase
MESLVHSVKVAMRSRDRQYQLRDYLVEHEQLLARSYTLYRELKHRVKSNLQVIQSLVRFSAKRAPRMSPPISTR